MPRKRAGRKSRTADRISLEKQLETAERRKRNLELKEAKFGDLYVPPYIQIDLEDEKRKIASLKRQISRSKPSNTALYYISESLASISQYLSRIDSWINKLSRGTTKRRKWRSHSTIISLSALGIITLSLSAYLSTRNNEKLIPAVPELYPSAVSTIIPISTVSSQDNPQRNQLQKAIIVNTRGKGVLYRSEPRVDSPSDNGPLEGESVYLIEPIINPNNEKWWKARFPDGRIGYIWDIYLQIQ